MSQDDLQHRHQGHGNHHAYHAEKLSANEDAGDDCYWMDINDTAHQFWHEEMAVQLLHDDIENDNFHHDAATLQKPQEHRRNGPNDRTD